MIVLKVDQGGMTISESVLSLITSPCEEVAHHSPFPLNNHPQVYGGISTLAN